MVLYLHLQIYDIGIVQRSEFDGILFFKELQLSITKQKKSFLQVNTQDASRLTRFAWKYTYKICLLLI